MVMEDLIPLIPLSPLAGFLLIGLLNRRFTKDLVSVVACGTVLVSFVLSAVLFFNLGEENKSLSFTGFEWIAAGNFSVSFSFLVDPLSVLMMLIITGVGFLIHLYSTGYMHED